MRFTLKYSVKGFVKGIITPISLSIIIQIFVTSGTNAQFFNGPESVTYDALKGRYLISNAGSGDIVQISDAGDTTFFDRTLSRTLGMVIVDNILYVADINGLVKFDLTTDQKIGIILSPGMIELNDITADTSGYLYITDSSAGKIFRMKISDSSFTTIASNLNIPNGILYDARNNRILFCQFTFHAPIKQIDLNDLSVTTVLTTSFTNLDGLTIDGNGNIYVSCWEDNAIYRYDNIFSLPAELISSGHNGPADIFYNQLDNILAVPNFYSDTVDFITVIPIGIEEDYEQMPSTFALWQNYPNPFNPSTKIKYTLSPGKGVSEGQVRITIKVYDVLGNDVATLVDEETPAGEYQITFYGSNYASGMYLLRMTAGNFSSTIKMSLLK